LRGITAPAGAVTVVTKTPSFSEIEGTVEQRWASAICRTPNSA